MGRKTKGRHFAKGEAARPGWHKVRADVGAGPEGDGPAGQDEAASLPKDGATTPGGGTPLSPVDAATDPADGITAGEEGTAGNAAAAQGADAPDGGTAGKAVLPSPLPDGPAHQRASGERPRRRVPKAVGVVLLVLALLAGATYGVGWLAFSRLVFMPNTTLNGQDVSLLPAPEVAERHAGETAGYKLELSGQGLSLSLSASDIGLRIDGEAYVEEALAQQDALRWPLEVLRPHRLTASETVTYSEDDLAKAVTAAVDKVNEGATQPTDARLVPDEKTKLYRIEPERQGTALDAERVVELAAEAVTGLDTSLDLGEEALVQPAVTSGDERLKAGLEEVNSRLEATQKLVVGEKDAFEVGIDLISRWVKVGKDYEVTIDSEAVTAWARGELSEKLDSVGAARTYTRPDGKQVSVSGGTYGWNIDGAVLAGQIVANLEKGEAATIDIPMLSTAETWNPGGQDWGSRYIDIDISEQHIRMYDAGGSVIWESDCVTGNTSEGHDTPLGVWFLNANKESGTVTLEGPIDDATGKPEYVSYVTYWMPFVENAVAMHDATWRYSFGGTVYQTNGSHGCVNLPYDKAEELYGICEVGDVVITHL